MKPSVKLVNKLILKKETILNLGKLEMLQIHAGCDQPDPIRTVNTPVCDDRPPFRPSPFI